MYSVIVTMRVREDRRDAFESLVRVLAGAVRAAERDNLAYHILRSRKDPDKYFIVEIYASKDAFKTHLNKDYVKQANPEVRATLVEEAVMEVTEVIA
jgi:quinol monooxygenase YgiN